MRAPESFSKTMIIAERGWHFPQCRYAKSFSRVRARPSLSLKSNDYSWEGLAFSSMMLREIVLKSTCEPLDDFQKTMIIAESGWYVAQLCYAKSFSKVHASPSMTFKNKDYSWEGLTFPSMPLREIVFESTFSPSVIFKNNDYSGEELTFFSMPLCEIVFNSTCEAMNDFQKQSL